MGTTSDPQVVQNLALTLNKLISSTMAVEFEKEENKTTMELLVLVLQHWITEFCERDQLILMNTMQILECLLKSCKGTKADDCRQGRSHLPSRSRD